MSYMRKSTLSNIEEPNGSKAQCEVINEWPIQSIDQELKRSAWLLTNLQHNIGDSNKCEQFNSVRLLCPISKQYHSKLKHQLLFKKKMPVKFQHGSIRNGPPPIYKYTLLV